ncbi:MAG: extracellular solute-binding protein family 5 [Marmoricola sp.]|jgi:peptide/nickel transport system substrate-binding protein|nr:extracellular solute-binding protein family 5 [Marmoricola sp.]
MRRTRTRTLAALGLVAALALAGCGSSGSGSSDKTKDAFNAAVGKVFDPSSTKGGIVKFADEGQQDSVDTGDTYYGYSWNFARLYGRSLTMFTPAPGKASNTIVGDLAEGLGEPSDNAKTWTFKLRSGVKFEDGTPITSKDVKYGVERSTDKDVFPDGPTYFDDNLAWPANYKGPYKTPDVNTDSAIATPDDQTIVFHFKQPFSDMNYLGTTPQSMPVPKAKDTGKKYKQHVVSSGPYMFSDYQDGKSFTLKRNPAWDAKTDPNRKALPDGYEVSLNVDANDIDNRILAGDLDIAYATVGVAPAMRARALSDPKLKARLDNPYAARLQYTSINPSVKPFDNIDCRKAIEYGMDRTAYQAAYGGKLAGGDPATTMLVPVIPGFKKFDLFPTKDDKGDLDKAKQALTACGQPNGFSTTMAYRVERPLEKATAEAFQQQLAKIGIKITPKGFPKADYFSTYAGNPPYVKKNGLGLSVNSWGADWNDGYGMLSQIVDGRVIRQTGGSSNSSINIPEVNTKLDEASVEVDPDKKAQLYADIDKQVMEQALTYPGVYAKLLLLRSKNLTNVFINDNYGGYDFVSLGVKKK